MGGSILYTVENFKKQQKMLLFILYTEIFGQNNGTINRDYVLKRWYKLNKY